MTVIAIGGAEHHGPGDPSGAVHKAHTVVSAVNLGIFADRGLLPGIMLSRLALVTRNRIIPAMPIAMAGRRVLLETLPRLVHAFPADQRWRASSGSPVQC